MVRSSLYSIKNSTSINVLLFSSEFQPRIDRLTITDEIFSYTYCQTSLPPTFKSSTEIVHIKFATDDFDDRNRGFKLEYQIHDKGDS